MKTILRYLLLSTLIFIGTFTYSQDRYRLTGIVTGDKGQTLKSATVFISGSEKITATNDDGKFTLAGMDPGSYKLSVTMLGYSLYTQNVIIKSSDINLSLSLIVKPIVLNEVMIGSAKKANTNYEFFKKKFLGTSANAKQCVILNPNVINFSTRKGVLLASTDEFLIIENKALGYLIKYLIKDFEYKRADFTSIYDGETSFEKLNGSPEMEKVWAKNRADVYKGSFMHFLRSVYANKVLKEGFLARQIYAFVPFKDGNSDVVKYLNRVILDPRPIRFDTLATTLDTSFISLKSPTLYVTYEPKVTARMKDTDESPTQTAFELDNSIGSILKLRADKAIIDRRGNYTNYRAFYIEGYWGRNRVGDQLPLEYQPPLK
jgi:hypothetical protein